MNEILTATLLVLGAFFVLVAGLGMVRMPDLLIRMSCSTKAGTIGIGLLLAALALYYLEVGIVTRSVATIAFIFLTAPVASHRIGRVAYLVGCALWEGTLKDELKGVYPPDACSSLGQECLPPDENVGAQR